MNKILNKLPKNKWFAAGAYGVSGMTMKKLEREGYAIKRPVQLKGLARLWDWKIIK